MSSRGFLKQAHTGVKPGKKKPTGCTDEERKEKQRKYEAN